jgi:ubiquinone/menaquinone biosynthesis C-methylase UbiE
MTASTRSASRSRPSQSADPTEYVLGTGHDEAIRLGLQHRLWSASAHELWERCAIRPGMTVMDVGCGPGHATMDLAQLVGPTGRVIAIDESASFLKQLHDETRSRKLSNVERILGDVQELDKVLPGKGGYVDIAYARWVFCFLARPEDLVRHLARVVRVGGAVAVQDYFNYESMTLAPRREVFTKVIAAVAASWRAQGGDPDIVARLPAMLRRHGFEVTSLECNQRVARPTSTIWHWPDSFWAVFVPRLVQMGFLTQADQQAFGMAWTEASADPDCFMQLPPVFDLVAVRKS